MGEDFQIQIQRYGINGGCQFMIESGKKLGFINIFYGFEVTLSSMNFEEQINLSTKSCTHAGSSFVG